MTRSPAWSYVAALEPRLNLDALETFARELDRWNKAIRLVGPKDLEGVRVQIADALAPFLVVFPAFPLLDIGSGAGLPGLPIALARSPKRRDPSDSEKVEVVCMEPLGKRVSFLRQAIRRLQLAGVSVVQERAEEALLKNASLEGSFATVTARAVAAPSELLNFARPYLARGGSVILPRGDEAALTIAGWTLSAVREYEGPPGVGPRAVHVYGLAAPS